jgi:hypothetical protein
MTLALNLAFSPEEKEHHSHISGFADAIRQLQSREFLSDGERFSFSLGRLVPFASLARQFKPIKLAA